MASSRRTPCNWCECDTKSCCDCWVSERHTLLTELYFLLLATLAPSSTLCWFGQGHSCGSVLSVGHPSVREAPSIYIMQPEYCEYWIHIGPEYTRGARSLHTNIFNKHQILVSNDSRWIQFQNRGKAAAAFFFPQNNRLNCTEFSNEHRPHFLWHDPPEKIPLDLAEKMSPPSILIYIMIIISASQGGPSTLFSLLESVNGSAGPSECWKATCRDPDCSHNDLLLLLLLQLPSRQLVGSTLVAGLRRHSVLQCTRRVPNNRPMLGRAQTCHHRGAHGGSSHLFTL